MSESPNEPKQVPQPLPSPGAAARTGVTFAKAAPYLIGAVVAGVAGWPLVGQLTAKRPAPPPETDKPAPEFPSRPQPSAPPANKLRGAETISTGGPMSRAPKDRFLAVERATPAEQPSGVSGLDMLSAAMKGKEGYEPGSVQPDGASGGEQAAGEGKNVPKPELEWIRLPEGTFLMGHSPGYGMDWLEKLRTSEPGRPVKVKAFEMAKSEVTNKQYGACIKAGRCTGAPSWCGTNQFAGDDQPVVCVTWAQALAFADWIGARLATEAEWEYAARSGGRQWAYPWGNSVPTCARIVMPGGGSGGGQGCGRGGTWPVCSKPAGNTEQGLCDMAGNAWEWTRDACSDRWTWRLVDQQNPRKGGAYRQGCQSDGMADRRIVRGGAWHSNYFDTSRGYDPGAVDVPEQGTGFRLARDIPAGAALTASAKPSGRGAPASAGGPSAARAGMPRAPAASDHPALVATWADEQVKIYSLALSPDGGRMVAGYYDGTIKLWDASSGRELSIWRGHRDKPVQALAYSPDGRRVVSGGDEIKVWEAATGRELATWPSPDPAIVSIAYSPDGRRVASAAANAGLTLWDAGAGRALRAWKRKTVRDSEWDKVRKAYFDVVRPGSPATSIRFSPDGRGIVCAGNDKQVTLWDAATGQERWNWRRDYNQAWTLAVAFSPDGRRVAAAGRTYGNVDLLDAGTGALVMTFEAHREDVTAVAFSPDGRKLVTGGRDKAVRVWDASTGRQLATISAHGAGVTSVLFLPDSRRVVSASLDGTIKLWDPGVTH